MTDLITKLEDLLGKATGTDYGNDRSRPLPWEVWTSCSYRRIKTKGLRGGLDVLSAYRCSDGGLDLSMPEDRLIALVEAVNSLPELIQSLRSLQARNDELEAGAKAARAYYEGYLQDEYDSPEYCLDARHHEVICRFVDSLPTPQFIEEE